MPDLGWDIAETQSIHKAQKENNPNMTLPLQTLITIIILIITVVKQMATQIKEIAKKAVQAMENTIKKASHNKILRNIKDFHRTAMLAITIATNMTDRTNHSGQAQLNNRNIRNPPGTQKPNDEYDESYQSLTSRTTVTTTTSMTSCNIVSASFTQIPNTEAETPEHKTLNNALVTTNEVSNITWKSSASHTPSHTQHENNTG